MSIHEEATFVAEGPMMGCPASRARVQKPGPVIRVSWVMLRNRLGTSGRTSILP